MTVQSRPDKQYDQHKERLTAMALKIIAEVNDAMDVPKGQERREYLLRLFNDAPDFATQRAFGRALLELVAKF